MKRIAFCLGAAALGIALATAPAQTTASKGPAKKKSGPSTTSKSTGSSKSAKAPAKSTAKQAPRTAAKQSTSKPGTSKQGGSKQGASKQGTTAKQGAQRSTTARQSSTKQGSTKGPARAQSLSQRSNVAQSKQGAARRKRQTASLPYYRVGQQQPTPDRIKEIQSALAQKGYLQGEPDGNWNPSTVDALKRFQQDQNLSADGKLSSMSLIALGLGPRRTGMPAAPSGTNATSIPIPKEEQPKEQK